VFEAACEKAGQPLTLRRSTRLRSRLLLFISTFIADHIAHHARVLNP
jgi:S-formylglutathione hydrolase